MKHDHASFLAAQGYAQPELVEDRVRRFVPMVRKSAWHIYGAGRDGLDVEDLMQVGYVALTECARKHAGPGEDGFAAYAKIRVQGAMYDVIRKLMPDSRSKARRRKRVDAARDILAGQLGRAPSDAEIAEHLGLDEKAIAEIGSAPVQLAPIDDSYDDHNTAFADDTPDSFEQIADMEDRERLVEALTVLPDRLQLILQLHFVEELNLSEIAETLEVSVPRVHQLKAQALTKLRAEMELDQL